MTAVEIGVDHGAGDDMTGAAVVVDLDGANAEELRSLLSETVLTRSGNFIFLTSHRDALAVADNNRRFYPIEVAETFAIESPRAPRKTDRPYLKRKKGRP